MKYQTCKLRFPIQLLLFCCAIWPNTALADKPKFDIKEQPIENAVASAPIIVIAEPITRNGDKQTLKITRVLRDQLKRTADQKPLAEGDTIVIDEMPKLPNHGRRRQRTDNNAGFKRHRYDYVRLNEAKLLLCLDRQKLDPKAKANEYELYSHGYHNALRLIAGGTAFKLRVYKSGNNIRVDSYGRDEMSEKQLLKIIEVNKLLRELEKTHNPTEAKAMAILAQPDVSYLHAKQLCKQYIAPKKLVDVLQQIVKQADQPEEPDTDSSPQQLLLQQRVIMSGSSSEDEFETEPDAVVAILEAVKDDGRLLNVLKQMIQRMPRYQAEALMTAGRCGSPAIPLLTEQLKLGSVADAAAIGLASIGSDQAAQIIEKDILNDARIRPIGFTPITVPVLVRHWPKRWEALVKRLKAENDRHRVQAFLDAAEKQCRQKKISKMYR